MFSFLRKRVEDAESSRTARPRPKTALVRGVLWIAPDVPALDDNNVPICPLCEEEGRTVPLRFEKLESDEYGMRLWCTHPSHGSNVPEHKWSTSDFDTARRSRELRDAVKR